MYENTQESLVSDVALVNADAEEERKYEVTSIKKIRLLGEEAQRAIIQMIEVVFGHFITGLLHLLMKEEGRHQVVMVAIAVSSLVFTMSMCREFINIVFSSMIRLFSKPRLIREWSSTTSRSQGKVKLSSIILPEKEKERVMKLCDTMNKGRARRAPLQNVIIYGKPGTGKSMIARAIADSAQDLPFAIMSGADVAPLQHLGPSELRNVISWASCKKNGGIIVIDEAESALGKRIRRRKVSTINGNSEKTLSAARDALNVFLSMTGESGGNMMMILTTSNPSSLDEAVLDRCDEMIHCELPTAIERFGILTKEMYKRFDTEKNVSNKNSTYSSKLFLKKTKGLKVSKAFDFKNALRSLSKDTMTQGFSGRELVKIIRAVENEMFLSGKDSLDMDTWNQVVNDICSSTKSKKKLHTKTK